LNQSSTDSADCYLKKYGSCWGPPEYEHEGNLCCVLHFPSVDKKDAFRTALEAKLEHEDFNFGGAIFPSGTALFADYAFSKEASFEGATFSSEADFRGATFRERAHFVGATFSGKAHFGGATFSGQAFFRGATFSSDTYFADATFKENARFYSTKTFPRTALNFGGSTIEKPERISFHTTYSRPSWFVDVDAQKFDFSDVEWFKIPDASKPDADELQRLTLEHEIEKLVRPHTAERRGLSDKDVQTLRKQSLRRLTKSCRRLMNNAEENRDYPTANELHYWSMEAQRKEGWSRLGLIATLYWVLSGYGERPLRAFGVLVGIWLTFAALYLVLEAIS
jgi:hypothetical protein